MLDEVLRRTGGQVVRPVVFFFQAEDGIRDYKVTGVQTCALPISEREISLRSGRAVWAALIRKGYDAIPLEVDASVVARLREVRAQIAFIALHGPGGEDGTIQGMLEVLRMPYTGSGVQACALAMDKAMTKCLLEHGDLPVPRGFVRTLRERRRPLPSGFKLPLVVKPVSQGSTLGITIIRKRRDLGAALQAAFAYGPAALV